MFQFPTQHLSRLQSYQESSQILSILCRVWTIFVNMYFTRISFLFSLEPFKVSPKMFRPTFSSQFAFEFPRNVFITSSNFSPNFCRLFLGFHQLFSASLQSFFSQILLVASPTDSPCRLSHQGNLNCNFPIKISTELPRSNISSNFH
jgi:hypothetical protein